MFDPFMTLGISPETTTFDDARARYRALVRQHHPDLEGGSEREMKRLTAAWREISTPERLDENSLAIRARRMPAARDATSEPHRHDVRTSDGIVHLGPFTRGSCLREADTILAGMVRAYRRSAILELLKGRTGKLRHPFQAPRILIPQAFSLSADRLYFYLDGPLSPGPALLVVPAMRRDASGMIGYSGSVAQSLRLEVSTEFTRVMGVGQSLVRGDAPPSAALIVEEN